MPFKRRMHSCTLDSASSRMIVFGGEDHEGNRPTDVWVLSTKESFSFARYTQTLLTGRTVPVAIFDESTQKLHVYGGQGDSGNLADAYYLAIPSEEGGGTVTGDPELQGFHGIKYKTEFA